MMTIHKKTVATQAERESAQRGIELIDHRLEFLESDRTEAEELRVEREKLVRLLARKAA